MSYQSLSQKEEEIATAIVDAAYKVHSRIGPGLIEPVYEVCCCHELKRHGLSFQRQLAVPIELILHGLVVCR